MRQITELEELKSIELSIMKRIARFCDEEGLTYSLAYGTLLGAVRHEGFIPWDDDIDIWMPRPDYDSFMERFPCYAEEHALALNSSRTTPGYNRVFAKVFDARTCLRETCKANPFEEGVFVDVFPVDGLPDGATRRWLRLGRLQFLKLGLVARSEHGFPRRAGESAVRFWGRRAMDLLCPQDALDRYEELARRSPLEGSRSCTFVSAGTMGRNCTCDAGFFRETVVLPFEDACFQAFAGYDGILTDRYGSYMELPPVEQRKPHHEFVAYWKDGFESVSCDEL